MAGAGGCRAEGTGEISKGVKVGELGVRWCRALQATVETGFYSESVGAIAGV